MSQTQPERWRNLTTFQCPNCSGAIKSSPGMVKAACPHCGNVSFVRDNPQASGHGVKPIKSRSGYEFGWLLQILTGAGIAAAISVVAGVALHFFGAQNESIKSQPPEVPSNVEVLPSGPFQIESDSFSLVHFDGKWQITLTCKNDEPIKIKDILVDGHAAQWVTSEMNHVFTNAVSGTQSGPPLNEVRKGHWILVRSQDLFSTVTIISDKGNFQQKIDASRWRY